MSDLNLSINIGAVDSASAVLRSVGKVVSDMAKGDFAGAAQVAAGAVIGIGVASVKMAADFQSGMTSLVTGAGESQSNLQMVSDGIKNLAVQTGTSTKQLTDGMYMIESAGYHGAEGLKVLQAAAEGAKVGNADLGVVANAVTTILTDYHLSADHATAATNALITTVADGKTHMQDLASSMGAVLPLASSVGISFDQVGGALATMTNAGKPAQQAAQNLANAIRSLSAPSGIAVKSMAAVGLKAQELKDTLTNKGLPAAIQMIEDHVGKKFPEGSVEAVTAFKNIMGGATGYNVALMLGGQNMKTFEGNVKSISGAMNSGSKDVQGWNLVTQDFNFKMQQAQQAVNVLMINLGTALLPVLGKVVDAFLGLVRAGQYVVDTITPIITTASDFWNVLQMISVEVSYAAGKIGEFVSALIPIGTDLDPIAQAIDQLVHGGLTILTYVLQQVSYAFGDVNIAADTGKGPLAAIGAAFMQVGAIIGGQLKADLTWLGSTFNQIGGWIKTSLMPALATLIPPFMSIASTIATNFLPAFAQIWASGHQLVEAILTPLIGVLENIIPPVISIAGWLAGGLAAGFKFVAPLVKGLADAISGLVTFFTKTELGGDLVKATLIALSIPVGILAVAFLALAIQAIAAFIMSIPAMVAGFLAGAAGAWSMAAGVIAATWPILAIIAVIALIILAIQHWGDIVGWLKTAWSAIATFFVGLWNGIVNGLKAAWNTIVNVVKTALMILLATMFAPIVLIAGLFIWLYQHNTYFKMLVDAIVNFFKGCFAWLQSAWQAVSAWLVGAWQAVVKFATDLWNQIAKAVQTAWNATIGFVVAVWQKISAAFSSAWNTYIVGPLTALWNNVSTVFANAWNTYIAGPLSGIWNSISKWFTDLGTNAMNSGKNFIQMLVNGITSGVGAIWNAVYNIATTIWKALGFHSPAKEGPGAEADTWMPNLVNMLSSGLTDGIPKIKAAVNSVVQPLTALASPQAATAASGPAVSSPTSSGDNNNIAIHVHLDGSSGTNAQKHGKDIADVVKRELARHLRQQSIAPRYTSGGTH